MILKNNTIKSLALTTSMLVIMGCSSDEKQTVTTMNNLVFQDEFNDDGAPNSANWSYNIGTGSNGWGNNELQYYTDRPENVVVEDGMLKITARRELYMGSNYTSARILTKGKVEQKYGRIEARIKLPLGQGLWPAFWMLGSDIDEVEIIQQQFWELFTVLVILEVNQSQKVTHYLIADLIPIFTFLELSGEKITSIII